MKPISFEQVNKKLTKPDSMTEEQCQPLPVYCDGTQCVSKWSMSWRERLHCLFCGFVWIRVAGGTTQPPMAIEAEKTVFTMAKGLFDQTWVD